MSSTMELDVKEVRAELGLSQSAMAVMMGISKRAIQSYEQGWRRPSETVERMLMLLLIAHRHGKDFGRDRCWEMKECDPDVRSKCVAYVTRQGHLCWFFTGTMCAGQRKANWSEKLAACMECCFMQHMLKGPEQEKNPLQMESE